MSRKVLKILLIVLGFIPFIWLILFTFNETYSYFDYINTYLFNNWKYRNTYIDCYEYLKFIGVNINSKKISLDSFINLIEFILNIQILIESNKYYISKLFDESGEPLWTTFQNNLKQNYVAGDMLDDMLKIDARFCTEIGIPNVNLAKASGVTDNEVEANNIDTKSKVSLWLETIKDGLNKVNNMFDLNLSVKLRFEGSENNVAVDTRNI